jgi:hypothetical protein
LLERLTVNAPVATVLGSIPASVGRGRHSGIWGAPDKAVLNKVRKKIYICNRTLCSAAHMSFLSDALFLSGVPWLSTMVTTQVPSPSPTQKVFCKKLSSPIELGVGGGGGGAQFANLVFNATHCQKTDKNILLAK